ncbi:hypothetical protein GCM10027419_01130 [Pandoraea terrae]
MPRAATRAGRALFDVTAKRGATAPGGHLRPAGKGMLRYNNGLLDMRPPEAALFPQELE